MSDANFASVAEAVRAAVNGQGFLHHLGARIDHSAPGRVVMSLDKRPELLQQHGFFHGGRRRLSHRQYQHIGRGDRDRS
jgi:acyl-coenzyme A thioesterase PaaI-like protein